MFVKRIEPSITGVSRFRRAIIIIILIINILFSLCTWVIFCQQIVSVSPSGISDIYVLLQIDKIVSV